MTMLPSVNYNLNLNAGTQGYPVNVAAQQVKAPGQTYVPQVQKTAVGAPQSDFFQAQTTSQQQYQPKQEVQLSFFDKQFARLGVFQDQLVKTAMKNNPKIAALCAQSGINGKIEPRNLDDVQNHVRATAKFAGKIGEYMGFEGEDLETLQTAAKFHDIGKALIPREVYAKPGAFNEDEKKIMALHSDLGAEILKGLGFDQKVIAVADNHHDGYNMFQTNKTGRMAQVVKVADVYSALTENRSYKKAMNDEQAFGILDNMAKKGEISPAALSALKQSIADDKAAFEVRPNASNPFATAPAAA